MLKIKTVVKISKFSKEKPARHARPSIKKASSLIGLSPLKKKPREPSPPSFLRKTFKWKPI